MEMSPGFGNRMQVEDGASQLSSSSISSLPNSPPQINGGSDTIRVTHPLSSNSGGVGGGVVANSASGNHAPATHAQPTNSTTTTQPNSSTNGTAPEKPKRQRKKKEIGPDGKPVVDEKPKEKKPRKPREPKDKTAAADRPAPSRKKMKTEDNTVPSPQIASVQSRQSTITAFTQPSQSTSTPIPPQQQQRLSDIMHPNVASLTSNSPTPRPYSSGQNYDPIRGSTMEQQPRPSNPPNGFASAQTSPHTNRASASPAIASLIDPPTMIKTAGPPAPCSPQSHLQQPFFLPSQQSPPPVRPTSAFAPPPQPQPSPPVKQSTMVVANMDGATEIDPSCDVSKQPIPEIKAPSKTSSSAPTPKQARPTPPPPKPTGSGLLSSSDLFGGPSSEPSGPKGPSIALHIPLNPRGENNINIAAEIAKKYGRDAVNPRAAAHRERLLRMEAAQNKLIDSNDDMSVDLMSDMEDNSNVEMGGMDDEKSNTGLETDGKPVRKRRRNKVEEYDKEDDFIDDTELAWQEQAAVAKDGFFVYSGPLVPAGQEAQVESSTSTRGRGGRARGRGSRTATAGSTHASVADKTRDPTTSTRSRARGTRGTGAPRKPRITKADRERMEAEKAERERAAGVTGASVTHSLPTTTTPASLVQTPTPAPVSHQIPPMPPPPPMPQQAAYTQPMGSMA